MEKYKINLEKVEKVFKGKDDDAPTVAVEEMTLKIKEGEIYCIVGPSGCGKSTVLNMIAGFIQPTSGSVIVNNEQVKKPGPDRAVVFQTPELFPWLSVEENVAIGPKIKGISEEQYKISVSDYLNAVGLEDFEKHYIYQISGGMQQRVALARALINNPDVILMDEPFAGLDAQTRLTMQELLLDIQKKFGTTIFFITHDIDEAVFLSDYVCVMGKAPSGVKEIVENKIPRPRKIEEVLVNAEFNMLRKHLLQSIRSELSDD